MMAAAAAARRAQRIIRTSPTALAGAPLLPARPGSSLFVRRCSTEKNASSSNNQIPEVPSELEKIKKTLGKLKYRMIELKVKQRNTSAGFWAMFFGFTTVLIVLPAWIYYVQLDAATSRKGLKKLEGRVETLEQRDVPKVSRVEVDVKFPRQD